MFCMLGLGGLNVPNTGEGFQNDENRVWGRFQNAWKNIHTRLIVVGVISEQNLKYALH